MSKHKLCFGAEILTITLLKYQLKYHNRIFKQAYLMIILVLVFLFLHKKKKKHVL